MVKLYRRGQASVEKHLSLSCSAVLIEYNIVIRAQLKYHICHLLAGLLYQTYSLFSLR